MQFSEIMIDGFNCFTNIVDNVPGIRGIAMYVRMQYGAQVVLTGKQADVAESVWYEVPLKDRDSFLIGTVYRSPNSSAENDKLNLLLKDITRSRTHVLVVGNFNYLELDWVEGTSE